ncbi:TIGR03016 family PEP-CTERM system-associated outer membrane protein [Nitrosomonas sp.]|uniref:TIGR03016 family PEP-CTERM system-associated outer membrane protein n=1 Tax=Nitrosomonas sp. TaxID=42353 RepID=UPI0025FBBE80|nr:TIGR03016 family PEP-CTERM system-associated outer membrane protein [Nitrosomonas sp.]MCC6916642.1 TIGR03016 family PEP-CTERM system-associated outer membrane protein [Nitrosomonas sp.]
MRLSRYVAGSPLYWGVYLKVSCILGLSSWISQAVSAEWDIRPRVVVSESYTDNIGMGGFGGGLGGFGGGGLSGSEFITQINPGIDITGHGRRFTSNLNYTLNNLIYARNGRFQARNQLAANGTAEIIKHYFFIDGTATVTQQNAFLFAPLAADNTNLTGNRRDIRAWNISPYIQHRFKNFASGQLRYAHGEVGSNARNFLNNTVDTVIFSLNSGSAFKTVGWGLNYDRSEISRKGSGTYLGNLGTIEMEKAIGSLKYMVTSQFSLIGTAGYERNSFISIRGRTSGPSWTVGFSWIPTKRTSISASGGKRFFGNTYAAAIDHRTRATVWSLSYNEDLTTFGQQSLSGGPIMNASMLSQLFSGTQGGQTLLNQGLPLSFSDPNNFLTNRVFLLKNLNASLTLNGKKNSLVFRAFNYSRKSFSPDAEDAGLMGTNAILTQNTTQTGGNMLWNHRLSPRTNANINFGYIRTSYDVTNQTDDNIIASTGLNKQLGANVNGSIMYFHQRRLSSRSNAEYSSNTITATLSMNF